MLKTALLLYPDINPFHFSVPYLAFKEAAGEGLFDVKIITPTGKPLKNQMMQPEIDGGLELLAESDIIVVPGWANTDTRPDTRTIKAFQAAAQRGAHLVGLCYGTYALAYAGILNGKQAATHWLGSDDFRQRFPQITLDINSIYVEDGNIITSAGSAAALDCCLHIIRKFYGVKAANKAARLLVVPPQREGGQAQFIERPLAQSTKDRKINTLIEQLRNTLHLPHSIDSAAAQTAMSRSTFTRHFKKATGTTFLDWLHKERLQRSLELLEYTSLSIEQIAGHCGFQNSVSFRTQFYRYYQIQPNLWRKRFGGGKQ
ncbi:GlxA family transcriptional regulator [Neisseria animalis]|uniref:Helix-turn-helix domain-containing protein n=1 Tax=Neisseria animalis TaxID=492 RepID=A0A5P3MQR7_NEIAN|nr:helix-turn-helix domain-containing protein [Neisseria animalis]QEY23141.1 helix-turn-helix domain-containing protein [Neisseria animalis]ROW32472.1 helix-turn-helix domain-containing protein [Neisseria animalis]VEE08227.1 AraC family transcription regulator [Neisseria animalis]